MDLSKIFKIEKIEKLPPQSDAISEMQAGESYTSFGKRMCMLSNGSTLTLRVILQRIYHYEKSRQLNDENIQRKRRETICNDIERKEVEIANARTNKKQCQQHISELNTDIAELKQQKIDAKSKNGELNKMARLKLVLGCVIIVLLTVYLYIFYSSTFYSAFFKDFGASDLSIGAAMFDAQAIPNALNNGFGELVFILSAPIIFMGLGYALHFFSVQKGVLKYVKISTVILITFIFDCILAYAIAKKIYEVESLTSWGDNPPFSIDMAFTNHDVWAVIFCGFVVYIIWGIVFDMTLTAYENLRSNNAEISKIEYRLENRKQQLSDKQAELSSIEGQLEKYAIELKGLNNALVSKASFDPNIIKQSFSQFFQGWSTVLGALLLPDEESKLVYEQEVNFIVNIPK